MLVAKDLQAERTAQKTFTSTRNQMSRAYEKTSNTFSAIRSRRAHMDLAS